jgi:EpsI family protein
MMHIGTRFLLTACFLAAFQGAVLWIQHGYMMGAIEPPKCSPRDLPVQLGEWKGEDTTTDPRLTGALQALASVDRIYRDRAGNAVYMHFVWTDDYIRIHLPQQCYREAGWKQTDESGISIPVRGDLTIPARLLTFERDEERIRLLYWFQLGDRFFFDRRGQRLARQQLCWGRTTWPPLVKVMLQTSDADPAQAEARLRDVARLLFLCASGSDGQGLPKDASR